MVVVKMMRGWVFDAGGVVSHCGAGVVVLMSGKKQPTSEGGRTTGAGVRRMQQQEATRHQ